MTLALGDGPTRWRVLAGAGDSEEDRMPSLFTSESVTEGHPDKLADQISDAILDAILAKDPLARVACEAIVTTGLVIVVGEITTDCYVDIPRIIRQTVREVGYTRAKYGFDAETCGVVTSIDEQSPDIAQGVDVGGAGDSGMMFGFACDDTPELMPLPLTLAHRLARQLAGGLLLGQGPHEGGSRGCVRRAARGQEHRGRGSGEQMRGPGLVRDRGGEAGGDSCRHVRHGQHPRGDDRSGGDEALRPEPARDHQGAQSPPAAVPSDGGVRPLRANRHRRALGVDGPRQGACRRGQVTAPRRVAVIPAGGAGTRLWPRSRASTPKHVLPFADRGRPLLRATYDRARLVADEVFVLTEARQRQIIEAVLPEVDESHLILEPYARGTRNASDLASLILSERTPGAVMIALPADHVVHGKAEVAQAVREAGQAAATTGCLVPA